uniref:Uncharacterized protein n=1 Tax=Anguilla anguilla TaxID=7936 RepID=A0A0E9VZJ3_ANGAN
MIGMSLFSVPPSSRATKQCS